MQLSFVFGNNVVKPQTPRIRLEDAEPEELPECYSTETLCLSRTKLQHVAGSVLKRSTLKVSLDFTASLCIRQPQTSSYISCSGFSARNN